LGGQRREAMARTKPVSFAQAFKNAVHFLDVAAVANVIGVRLFGDGSPSQQPGDPEFVNSRRARLVAERAATPTM